MEKGTNMKIQSPVDKIEAVGRTSKIYEYGKAGGCEKIKQVENHQRAHFRIKRIRSQVETTDVCH